MHGLSPHPRTPPPHPHLQEHCVAALVKLQQHVLLLPLEGVADGAVGNALPVVQAVNLGEQEQRRAVGGVMD